MPISTDQLGRTIELSQPPKRVISLVPSQTELLFDLGLEQEVIGITKFCVHPRKWLQTKTKVGGTKQLHMDVIKDLNPDLIIANKEENVREQIEELQKQYPVWISDINTLDDALKMIVTVGEMVDRIAGAKLMATSIAENFGNLKTTLTKGIRAAYLIWKEPYMVAGGSTFINNMMQRCGFENVFSYQPRYPEVYIEDLQSLQCELVLLSSEPYPFKEKHIRELEGLLPRTIILLVDGEMFSWHGSRLLKAPPYFKQLQNLVLSLTNARGTE
jgi:ABC-type Fe3+-hydroxamate transport system substrate-binding protein